MSIAEIVIVCVMAGAISVLVIVAATIVRRAAVAENDRDRRQSVVPAKTDHIDEHQSDDAPEFRSVKRDPLGNLKFRRY